MPPVVITHLANSRFLFHTVALSSARCLIACAYVLVRIMIFPV